MWDAGDSALKSLGFILLAQVPGTAKTYKVEKGLKPGANYRFWVSATNEVGVGKQSDILTVSTAAGAPSQPEPPVLRTTTTNTLHLSWSQPISDGGAAVTEYSLEMKTGTISGKDTWMPRYCGGDTATVVSKLSHASSYVFRLTATNQIGSSKTSSEATFQTAPEIPGFPLDLATVSTKIQCITVACRPPDDDGGAPITEYIAELSEPVCATNHVKLAPTTFDCCSHFASPVASVEMAELKPGSAFFCRLRCRNTAGLGPYSKTIRVCTNPVPPGAPAAPMIERGNGNEAATTLKIGWCAPAVNGGAKIKDYILEKEVEGRWVIVLQASVTFLLIRDIPPNTSHTFRVTATNSAGQSEPSNTSTLSTSAAAPSTPGPLTALLIAATSAQLSWGASEDNGMKITQYILEQLDSVPGGKGIEVVKATTTVETVEIDSVSNRKAKAVEFLVKGLLPASEVRFRVKALNGMGVSNESAVLCFHTLPAVPNQLSAPSVDRMASTALRVSWVEPNNNGSAITSYSVIMTGGDKTFQRKLAASEHFCTFGEDEPLPPSTKFKVRVKAANAVGLGPFSLSTTQSTGAVPPQPPQLDLAAVTHNAIKVKWIVGKGSDIIETKVQVRNKYLIFDEIHSGAGKSEARATKLDPNKLHEFRICAANTAGWGPFGPPAYFRTTQAPLEQMAPVVVSQTEEGTVILGWEAPSAGIVADLQFRCVNRKSFVGDAPANFNGAVLAIDANFMAVYSGSANRIVVSGLLHERKYEARVRLKRETPLTYGLYSDITVVRCVK